jgi:hypothetical protein
MTQFVNIYPNPTNGALNITWSGAATAIVTIHDIHGKVVKQIQGVDNLMNLTLNDCENGVYLVQVEANQTKLVKRIIKN